jgi:hypothetical protein
VGGIRFKSTPIIQYIRFISKTWKDYGIAIATFFIKTFSIEWDSNTTETWNWILNCFFIFNFLILYGGNRIWVEEDEKQMG